MVEKFAGDAVMAAFGVPRTHEDDAAARRARGVRGHGRGARARARGADRRRGGRGRRRRARESTFATGEAVNIAARLQQAAGPGEIVLGPAVRRLAAGAVEVEDAGPLEIKGRPEPIWTWRAIRVARRAARRRAPRGSSAASRSSSCSRTRSRARSATAARASSPSSASPGIGKTRLVVGVRRRRRARDGAQRPRASVRRGHHLLAARLDDQGVGRDHRRRARLGGVREAPALLRERGRRRPARGRARRARRRRGRTQRGRADLGGDALGRAARRGAAARARLRGRAVGRGAPARRRRAPRPARSATRRC